MLDLLAQLAINTKPYERGLTNAATFGEKWGTDFSKKFGKKMMNAFGAFGLAGAGVGLIRSIFGRPEEIESIAEQFKLTTDQVQQIEYVANNTGISIKRLVEMAKSGNVQIRSIIETASGGAGAGISQRDLRDISAAAGMLQNLLNDTKAFWARQMVKLFPQGTQDAYQLAAARDIPKAMRTEVARRTGIRGGQFAALTALQAGGRVAMAGPELPQSQLDELRQIHEDLLRIANAVEKQTVKPGDFYTPIL